VRIQGTQTPPQNHYKTLLNGKQLGVEAATHYSPYCSLSPSPPPRQKCAFCPQLLAYLSKYPHVHLVFYKPRASFCTLTSKPQASEQQVIPIAGSSHGKDMSRSGTDSPPSSSSTGAGDKVLGGQRQGIFQWCLVNSALGANTFLWIDAMMNVEVQRTNSFHDESFNCL
jgi:hypothetical protein